MSELCILFFFIPVSQCCFFDILIIFSNEKLGGWVAENYVALGKCCTWIFSDLHELEPDDPPFEEPNKPQQQWRKVDNEGWLRARGLDAKGNAAKLRARVADYMSLDDIPPIVTDRICDAIDAQRMVVALSAMLTRLMSKSVTDALIDEAEQCIKVSLLLLLLLLLIFLSQYGSAPPY